MASRLASQQSAYLRSAAHQPVEWHPWSAEAFERAKRENKPILLDIGAVWCHWCHVMDGESYENPRVAEALNRDWICIKVDRDERPDVDARYQRAVQLFSGQGGWPLTGFLTPDGEVFYGGTYFPPDGMHGRPGFLTVLAELSRIYREEPARVSSQAEQIRRHLEGLAQEASPGPISDDLLHQAAEAIARAFDFRNGGFGTQPKFPHPGACDFLLARWFDTRHPWLRDMVDRTLAAMARGGVFDQIGGGFHRYSVDARWIVPHFEKMAYDNSELLRVYLHAAASAAPAAATEKPQGAQLPQEGEYHRVIEGITDWIMSVLAQPGGGYAASQDADVGLADDGDYFTWTPEEARAAVTEAEFAALVRHYDIDDAGEMHHNPKKNVLWVRQSASEIAAGTGWPADRVAALLESGRGKLRQARAKRQAPSVDTTVYTGWSAMMASALLEAAVYLGRPDVEHHALATLERLFTEGAEQDGAGGVRHALGGADTRVLEDQVHVACSALDGFEVTGDVRWLTRASALARYTWAEFASDDGGLYDLPRHRAGEGFLSQRLKPAQDAPAPSGNGVAGLLAARLAEHTGDPEWRVRLQRLLGGFAGSLAGLSLSSATLLRAADWYLHPAAHVVIVGPADDATARQLMLVARRTYRPRKVLTRLLPGADPSGLPAPLRTMLDGRSPRAYVCAGTACAAPTDDPAELAATITTFARPDA
ncbi:MAG: thioredoxin domain-containing protein [Gemmatimonadetes bacterium]|nr:thioredoxin domain-containing protein [Gemmatimonadota bacterium]